MMRPVHLVCNDENASGKRWTNAVHKMTPVPKCLPTKNTMGGTRSLFTRLATEGKETAISETSYQ